MEPWVLEERLGIARSVFSLLLKLQKMSGNSRRYHKTCGWDPSNNQYPRLWFWALLWLLGHPTSLEQALAKPSLKSDGSLRKQDKLASAAFADRCSSWACYTLSSRGSCIWVSHWGWEWETPPCNSDQAAACFFYRFLLRSLMPQD